MRYVENSQDLVRLHEGRGVIHKPVDLRELYEKDIEKSVSFEIAFTAFLSSIALTTPRTGSILDWLAPWVGGGLILLTIVRRMALDNIFIDKNRIFESTLKGAIYFSTFLMLYVALSWAGIIHSVIGVNIYTLTGLVLLFIVFGSITAYELLYRDQMFWAAILFYNNAVDKSNELHYSVRVAWLIFARFTLQFSLNEYNEDHYVIQRIYDIDLDSYESEGRIALGVIGVFILLFIGVVVGVFAVPMSWMLGVPFRNIILVNLALLVSIYPAVSLIEFVYVRYGSAKVADISSGRRNVVVAVLMYGSVLVHGGLIEKVIVVLQGFLPA